ncbi:glycoside hydrolase family 88/105 protein [Salinibacter sp.]|uniref:glycoside hydrolase family 88/105 protein n=1 Tax=Salinibacter sp. TaxID=2065818 RepID=UPI0021E74231|nr:glycoside hydrolase family 88 protein [Salinibacter sp.]
MTVRNWVYFITTIVLCASLFGCDSTENNHYESQRAVDPFRAENIRTVLRTTLDYELGRRSPIEEQGPTWRLCALYVGALSAYSVTGDPYFRRPAYRWAEAHAWSIPDEHTRHADYQCTGQVYLDLYALEKESHMLADTREVFDEVMATSRPGDEMWDWADALFMAPPVLARLGAATGSAEYFHFMSQKFWEASVPLFDGEQGLYYRDERYVDRETESGEDVFWSRGNGWVLAGIVRILQHLPPDHPSHDRFVDRFRTMAAAVAPLQHKDGRWRPSLLDPDEFPAPETSGTAFFTYALAWGINEDYLSSETYRSVVEAGWEGLVEAVNKEGRLGWVQPIGSQPGPVQRSNTGAYGVGGFLMAGSEVLRMVERRRGE